MGSSARSYGFRTNWKGFVTPAIKAIVLLCTGVFLAQTLVALFLPVSVTNTIDLELGLVPRAVTHGLRFWQPLTYIFLHGGILHLLLNMLFLWMFGVDLERAWGTRRFWNYFLVTGIGAGLVNIFVKTALDPHGLGMSLVPTIGASGAIYGVLVAAAIVFPDRQVWLIPFPVHIPMRIYVIAAIAIEFFFTLGAGGDNVSHVTHLGGALVGYIYLRRGSFLYRARNGYLDWKRKRARRKFEVYARDHRDEPPTRPDNWVN
jgi:membrane associated rhomboid family serine protease